ncbi:MAG: hypothetical protein QXU97_04085 [Fervidicoccaceae archaeon]
MSDAVEAEICETLYSSLRAEAKVSYYVERLSSAYSLLLSRLSVSSGRPSEDLVASRELLEDTLARLKIVASNLRRYRLTLSPYILKEAVDLMERAKLELDARRALPSVKSWISIALEDVKLELWSLYRGATEG